MTADSKQQQEPPGQHCLHEWCCPAFWTKDVWHGCEHKECPKGHDTRTNPPAPVQTIPLEKFVLHLSRINAEMNTVLSKINRFDDKMDSDEMSSEEKKERVRKVLERRHYIYESLRAQQAGEP
jgi:hypothetical protein